MTNSDFYTKPRWRTDRRIAHPYFLDESGQRVDGLELNAFIGAPAGGSFASAPDLIRFVNAVRRKDFLGHGGGSTYGVSCNVYWFPDSDWVTVVLANYGEKSAQPVTDKLRELITRPR
jgi:hypothetical protein